MERLASPVVVALFRILSQQTGFKVVAKVPKCFSAFSLPPLQQLVVLGPSLVRVFQLIAVALSEPLTMLRLPVAPESQSQTLVVVPLV
jgi:hypothetical protein